MPSSTHAAPARPAATFHGPCWARKNDAMPTPSASAGPRRSASRSGCEACSRCQRRQRAERQQQHQRRHQQHEQQTRSRAGRPRSCPGPARRPAADTACRAAPSRRRSTAAGCWPAAGFRARRRRRARRRSRRRRAQRVQQQRAADRRVPRKIRMKRPRAGSAAKACTLVSTPERTRKVPSSDSENVGDGQQQGPAAEAAALFGDRLRMQQRRAGEPRHEAGVLDRIPEPPAAPAEFVVRPPRAQRDAEGEEGPGDVRPRPRPAQPARVDAGRRAARRSRTRTAPRNRRSRCTASADG